VLQVLWVLVLWVLVLWVLVLKVLVLKVLRVQRTLSTRSTAPQHQPHLSTPARTGSNQNRTLNPNWNLRCSNPEGFGNA
jgi:hypothetical protein